MCETRLFDTTVSQGAIKGEKSKRGGQTFVMRKTAFSGLIMSPPMLPKPFAFAVIECLTLPYWHRS